MEAIGKTDVNDKHEFRKHVLTLFSFKSHCLDILSLHIRAGMAQELEWPSCNQNVTGLIPGSSKDFVKVSLSKTLNNLFLLMCHLCVNG